MNGRVRDFHARGARASGAAPFAGVGVGTAFGPVEYKVSAAANDRYWRAAGIEHGARGAAFLYPPMAANLTILAFQTVAPAALLHTSQRIECHAAATAPSALTVAGTVTGRFERRGREYVEVTTTITDAADTRLWTSIATFIEAGTGA